VARRGSPPDWFDVHPQGTIHPLVSPLATTINGRSAPLGRQPTIVTHASSASRAKADSQGPMVIMDRVVASRGTEEVVERGLCAMKNALSTTSVPFHFFSGR
jgi:hypothetical protein